MSTANAARAAATRRLARMSRVRQTMEAREREKFRVMTQQNEQREYWKRKAAANPWNRVMQGLGTVLGAGVGTLIAPGVGTAIGAGLGGVAGEAGGTAIGAAQTGAPSDYHWQNFGGSIDGLVQGVMSGAGQMGNEQMLTKMLAGKGGGGDAGGAMGPIPQMSRDVQTAPSMSSQAGASYLPNLGNSWQYDDELEARRYGPYSGMMG